jgi:DNA-binding response OmpR family regulator
VTDTGAFPPGGAAGRVLVAEDEFLVYLALEEELRANGYQVVGPFTTVTDICLAATRERFDVALLDINLGGEMIYPVVDALLARKVPFIFLSGYSTGAVPEGYRAFPRLEKPYDPAKLMAALRQLSLEKVPDHAPRGDVELPAA